MGDINIVPDSVKAMETQELIDILEKTDFIDDYGGLSDCPEWVELKRRIEKINCYRAAMIAERDFFALSEEILEKNITTLKAAIVGVLIGLKNTDSAAAEILEEALRLARGGTQPVPTKKDEGPETPKSPTPRDD